MPATVVSFINLKGGVGKSTLALAIGETLAFRGKMTRGWGVRRRRGHEIYSQGVLRLERQRVLLIDIDLQSNLSYATTSVQRMEQLDQSRHTVYHMFASALQGKAWDIRSAINKQCSNIIGNTHLHGLVCSYALGELDEDMLAMLQRGDKLNVSFREILKGQLDQVRDDYDYIFIDCPPSLSPLTSNAIVASDYFVVPIIPEELSLQGINLLQNRIRELKNTYPYVKAEFMGSILNKVDIRRRRDHLRLAEEVVTVRQNMYEPFTYWLGDWTPLYTVSNFDYYQNDGWTTGWPSWQEKYGKHNGRNIRPSNPYDDARGPHAIWPKNESKTFYLSSRIVELTNEFVGRLP